MRWRLLAMAGLGPGLMACSSSAGGGPNGSPANTQTGDSSTQDSSTQTNADGASADSPLDDGSADSPSEAQPLEGGGQGDAATPDGGGAAGDSGGLPPVPGGHPCNQTTQWGTGTLLPVSTSSLDRFGAITPDELTIAWMTPDTSGGGDGGPTGTVHYADRAAAGSSFGAPQTLAPAAGYFAFGPVALSPDGRSMVVVRSDLQGFATATRPNRAGAFGAPDETPFSGVDINHYDIPVTGSAMDDPVFAQDGQSLFFTSLAASTLDSVTSVDLVSGAWGNRVTLFATPLEVSAGKLRRPTGLSSDRLTLFFYDETTSLERMAWRTSAGGTFTQFKDLGPQLYAQPNAACNRIYYSAQGASSVDLFYADGM